MTETSSKLCFAASRVRDEERRLLDECAKHNLEVHRIDPRNTVFEYSPKPYSKTIVLNREISAHKALAIARTLERSGARVVNSAASTELAMDKWLTYLTLRNCGIPTPETKLLVDSSAAHQLKETVTYPVVLKPVTASHGNRVSLVTDKFALEAVLEHCDAMPHPTQRATLIQEFLGESESDLRLIVIDGECVGGIRRTGSDWRNNVARGGRVERISVDFEIETLAVDACAAIGTTIAGVDVMVTKSGTPVVLEVNNGVEFRGFESAGTSVAELIVCYLRRLLEEE